MQSWNMNKTLRESCLQWTLVGECALCFSVVLSLTLTLCCKHQQGAGTAATADHFKVSAYIHALGAHCTHLTSFYLFCCHSL